MSGAADPPRRSSRWHDERVRDALEFDLAPARYVADPAVLTPIAELFCAAWNERLPTYGGAVAAVARMLPHAPAIVAGTWYAIGQERHCWRGDRIVTRLMSSGTIGGRRAVLDESDAPATREALDGLAGELMRWRYAADLRQSPDWSACVGAALGARR